jgi:hypothetical protein
MGQVPWRGGMVGGGRMVRGEGADSAHATCSTQCWPSEHDRVRSRGRVQGGGLAWV